MLTQLIRFSRKWHRWTAWGIGIFAMMWFVTGIFMVLPFSGIEREVPPSPLRVDSAIVTPSAAIATLAKAGVTGPTRALQLRQIGDRTLYLVSAHGWHAVDARTGLPFEIAESTAVRLATSAVREGATLGEVKRLNAPTPEFDGPFPAYRISFGGAVRASAIVSNIGDVRVHDERVLLHTVAGRLHTFAFPKVPLSLAGRRNLLIAAALFAVFLACTGFVLLVPVRRRPQS